MKIILSNSENRSSFIYSKIAYLSMFELPNVKVIEETKSIDKHKLIVFTPDIYFEITREFILNIGERYVITEPWKGEHHVPDLKSLLDSLNEHLRYDFKVHVDFDYSFNKKDMRQVCMKLFEHIRAYRTSHVSELTEGRINMEGFFKDHNISES